jgi:thiol-disulfide isomerase/thioredoxin
MMSWVPRVFCVALVMSCLVVTLPGQPATSPGSGQPPPVQSQAPPPDQSVPNHAPQSEEQELALLIQESNRSPVDFVRDLEKFLQKYPNAKRKNEITRGLFQASRDLKDNRRIATYGERLLVLDPNDISVLGVTGRALNTFDDSASAAKALEYGQRLEQTLREGNKLLERETNPREKGQRRFELYRMLGDSLVIQANALGTLGKLNEAVAAANKGFEEFPSAEAARAIGRWLEKEGKYQEAVTWYANAFALPDSGDGHGRDRLQLSALYLKAHKSEAGLGDVVLSSYDKMTVLAEQKRQHFGNTPVTEPINFQLSGPEGAKLPLLSLKGKVIVIDFWATWCQPCRIQHPLFEEVKNRFKSDDRVVFLEVNADTDRSLVPRFLVDQKWDSGIYYEDGLVAALGIQNLPTTVLLGRSGDLYSKLVGFSPNNFVQLVTDRINEALTSNGTSAPPMATQAN